MIDGVPSLPDLGDCGGFNRALDAYFDVDAVRKEAEAGDAVAQLKLGMMYADGLSVEQDYPEAYKWCSLAAENGDVDALRLKGVVGRKMGISNIIRGKKLLSQWKKKHPSYRASVGGAPDLFLNSAVRLVVMVSGVLLFCLFCFFSLF